MSTRSSRNNKKKAALPKSQPEMKKHKQEKKDSVTNQVTPSKPTRKNEGDKEVNTEEEDKPKIIGVKPGNKKTQENDLGSSEEESSGDEISC